MSGNEATKVTVAQENEQLRQRVAELEQQVEQYASIIYHLPDGLFVYHLEDVEDDRTLRMTEANPAVEKMAGVDPTQIIGTTLDESFPGLRDQGIPQLYANVIRTGESFSTEVEYGDERVIESAYGLLAVPLPYNSIVIYFQNVTQQKRVERELKHLNHQMEQQIIEKTQELRQSEERLNYILVGSDDGAWDWDLATNEAYFSDHYKHLIGYKPDELEASAETWLSLMHPEDRPRVEQALHDYLEGRAETYAVEHRLQHKSGEWIWMLARGKAVQRSEDGVPLRMAGTIGNFTERKEREIEHRRIASVIEASSDFIAFSTMEGEILYVNQAGCDLVGLAGLAEARTKTISDQHFPEDIPFVTTEMLPSVFEHEEWSGNIRFRHFQTGEAIPFSSTVFLVKDMETGEPLGMANISRDRREEIAAEEERLALQEQVIQAQQSAIRELSTPLIPLTKHVVLMPLIGSVDSSRAQLVMETLLEGIASHQADIAILDITGVSVVDTQVANALVQTAQAVKLLGAQVILTGIGSTMAQTLIHLGADLSSIQTRGSLQSGIAYAMRDGL